MTGALWAAGAGADRLRIHEMGQEAGRAGGSEGGWEGTLGGALGPCAASVMDASSALR